MKHLAFPMVVALLTLGGLIACPSSRAQVSYDFSDATGDLNHSTNNTGKGRYDFSDATGDLGHSTSKTGEGPTGMGANVTTSPTLRQNQATANAPYAPGGHPAEMVLNPGNSIVGNRSNQVTLAPVFGPRGHDGLPPTSMDSFVANSGGMAFFIYGDEGTDGPPPLQGYNYFDRINAGISGSNNAGLTTGHGSYMPSGTGGDEFTGAEWSRSGAN